MNHKLSLYLIIGTALAFTAFELVGHVFLMAVPMTVRHGLSIVIGTTLAMLIAAVSIQVIWRQHKQLKELARLRDYLLRMQSHYLRLSPSARMVPFQQLEHKALELRYADIEHGLVSESAVERARGLMDLAELAETHVPYMPVPYPYFPHAASHVAAALYLETEPAVRVEAQHSLQALAAFARDKDAHLIELLIGNLAHANSTAYRTFVDALAGHLAGSQQIEDGDLRMLLPIARFTKSEETDMAILRDIAASPALQEAINAQRVVKEGNANWSSPNGAAMDAAKSAATALRDSRDALTYALRALSAPPDFPANDELHRYWKRSSPLSLRAAFLVGANLDRAQMQGIDLQQAYLQAASMSDVQLQNADLSGASLWKAELFAASLQNAKLWGANLRDVSLAAANLERADLSRSRLQGARLIGAQLKDACLWQIQIADDAEKREHCADFTQANWWDARFTDLLTDSDDAGTSNWLKYTFPKPLPNDGSPDETPDDPFAHASNDPGGLMLEQSGRASHRFQTCHQALRFGGSPST